MRTVGRHLARSRVSIPVRQLASMCQHVSARASTRKRYNTRKDSLTYIRGANKQPETNRPTTENTSD